MFYAKRIAGKTAYHRKAAVTFTKGIVSNFDDKSLSLAVCKLAYNCSGESGALVNIKGIKTFDIPYVTDGVSMTYSVECENDILRAWHYKRTDYTTNECDDRIVLFCSNFRLYEVSLTSPSAPTAIGTITFSEIPVAVNYKLNDSDVIMFSSPSDSLTVYDGVNLPYQVSTAPKIRSMCTHYERLFAVGEDNLLWFSDDLDPTNWNISLDQAGYIEFADNKGKLLKVISFLDYVYVFRRYGITRVTAYADQTEFYVNEVYATGNIYPETVAVCGDTVYFLSKDGLYSFDGLTTKKIFSTLDGLWPSDNEDASAVFIGNEYFLCCKMDFGDDDFTSIETENGNNTLLILNVADGTLKIIRIGGLLYINGILSEKMCGTLVCLSDENSKKLAEIGGENYFDNPIEKFYLTPETDFGFTLQDKFVRYISVNTQSDITVGICADGQWSKFDISGGSGFQKIPIGIKGKLFRIALYTAQETMKIKPVEITYVNY
ncbi:MAG TPA: hypothetical protein PK675_04395 [Clostridia bacterium]|nr:hypothetical protein [Clostridia bacterium]